VPLAAIQCKHCGTELDNSTRRQTAKWSGATVRRSRGGSIIAAAVVSFIWLLALCIPLLIFFGMGGRGLRSEFVLPLAGGLFLCTIGAVIAYFDLKGMNSGRVNPNDQGTTLVGAWMNGLTVLLYWFVIGLCIFSGMW